MSAALLASVRSGLDFLVTAIYCCLKGITVAAVAQLVEQLIRNQAPSFKQFLQIITLNSSLAVRRRRCGSDLLSAALARVATWTVPACAFGPDRPISSPVVTALPSAHAKNWAGPLFSLIPATKLFPISSKLSQGGC